jgi:hypothetical protein
MTKKWKKFTAENFVIYRNYLPKIAIYLFLGLIKDVRATGEAFSSQKKISSISKHEIFALLDPNPLA